MSGLNPKQQEIVDSFGLGQAVIAGAGCGKTTTLVAKCLALLQKNPKSRFCAVSFTEKSVRDLKESLAQGFQNAGFPQALGAGSSHWVKTIHGLCASIIQEFPEAAGLQGGERILIEDEAKRLWDQSLRVLWTSTENESVSEALDRLLNVYSRAQLEAHFLKLRSLLSFGVAHFITQNFNRSEVKDLWFVFETIHHRYAHAKNREGALDFNDLEVFAYRALQNERVQKYFQSRFDLVLVDEFQDTNPLQGEILEKFTKPDFSNLCIVGDPKQSIYRFRDADVSVFQDLTKKLPKKHLLDTNYRSRPSIIHFVNQVCAPTFQAVDLPYEPLAAGRVDPDNHSKVFRLEIESEVELAQFLKSEQMKGIDLSDYVILVRSVKKDKTQNFLKALETEGVPFLLGSGGRFYSDPRVQELIAFLRGWVSSEQALSQVAALRAPWISVPDSTLMTWAESGKNQYFDRFFVESDHPVAQALKDLYLSVDRLVQTRPGEILERLLKLDALDEELEIPLVTLWHKAEDLSGKGRRFEEVVQAFSNAVQEEKIEKEIPAPAASGMVRVMTVHSSKGLQFPRVLLLDFDGEYKSQSGKADLIWDRKKGVHLFHRDEDGKRIASDPENQMWSELEKAANVAESKRVFYVALTRAQEELILVWKKDVKRSRASESPSYRPHLVDDWRAWIEASLIPERREFDSNSTKPAEVTREKKIHSVKVTDFNPEAYRPRHSPSEWLILSQCDLRYHKKFQFIESEDQERKVSSLTETDQELPETSRSETAEKGEKIHALIETESWDELALEFRSPEIGRSITQKLIDFLSKKNDSPDATQAYPELGFEVPFNAQEALVGMMDRLEVNSSRESIRVIDYKFTSRAKKPEALLQHYTLQLKLYAWAASKLVSFKPQKLEAFLVHFTLDDLQMIQLDPRHLNLENLEKEVQNLLKKAKSFSSEPHPGEHCTFCEFTDSCPAFQNSLKG